VPASAGGEGRPLFASTWGNGAPVNEEAMRVLRAGGSLLDAVEQGIWVSEADAANPNVGIGGIPNEDGVVQLDACFMSGPGHRAGSVAALEGFLHPISVARRVMEKTRHVMLVGRGARKFALAEGFEPVELLSDEQRERWRQWRRERWEAEEQERAAGEEIEGEEEPGEERRNHDTMTLLGLGADGHLAGGCSTSGWGYKMPGRVGDSPIVGGGLYVDDEVGAAGATGLGEIIMSYCGSFLVVDHMRQGMSPEEACAETVRRIIRHNPRGLDLGISFVAVDKQGRHGAAGTVDWFRYAVTTESETRLLSGLVLGREGGER